MATASAGKQDLSEEIKAARRAETQRKLEEIKAQQHMPMEEEGFAKVEENTAAAAQKKQEKIRMLKAMKQNNHKLWKDVYQAQRD